MTSGEIHHLTAVANEIGKPACVTCRYEYDRHLREFAWRFFRHGRYIGSTTVAKNVVVKAERYASAEKSA